MRPVIAFVLSHLLVRSGVLVVRIEVELAAGRVGRTVLDRGVPVADVAEVMDFVCGEEGAGCEGVDRCVAPLVVVLLAMNKEMRGGGRESAYALHPEPPTTIHIMKKLLILPTPEPIQPCNLKVTPEMTPIVHLAFHGLVVDLGKRAGRIRLGLGQRLLPARVVLRVEVLVFDRPHREHLPHAFGGDVVLALVGGGVAEEVGDRFAKLFDGDGEAVGFVVFGHFDEWVAEFVSHVRSWDANELKRTR